MIKKLILFLLLTRFFCNAQVKIVFVPVYDQGIESLVIKELNKYPRDLLLKYLDSVVVRPFNMCGRSHPYKKYFIVGKECEQKTETIHHEMSSVFLLRYDIYGEKDFATKMQDEFYKINSDKVFYNVGQSKGYIDANSPLSDYFYKRYYATTNFENDFNVIAGFLWTEGKETVDFMINNPNKPVSKKIKLVLDFYQLLHPAFTVEFFKSQNI